MACFLLGNIFGDNSSGVKRQNNFAMFIVKYFDVLGNRELFVARSVFTKFQVFPVYDSEELSGILTF